MGIFDWLFGKKQGLFKTYHENGQLKEEGNWKDGEEEMG